ncbi:MAG: hypothetical protein EXS35_14345 [Pedosphaera sp.]|nr:hypothetical protein [Pedosphaera sp.]
MKPPPFLLGTALAFWGWQSDFLIPGVMMGLIVESARLVQARWEFSDEDFSRVWTFCSLLFLAAGVFAFTNNNGPESFGNWFQNPGFRTQGGAGLSAARTGAAIFRWLPMIFFPFLAAQLFSVREIIPLSTISLLVRRRQRREKKAGRPVPPSRNVNIAWPYFVGTVLAASVHRSDDASFFWGLAVLLAWALWTQRSGRFALVIWFATLAVAVALGFTGQRGYGYLQRYLEGMGADWLSRLMRRNVDSSQTRTALGQIGDIKTSGRIVIRLEPKKGSPVPTYLREASYRFYKAPAWSAGSSRDDFQGVPEEAPVNSGNWTVLKENTNTHGVNIACYLEGVKHGSSAGLLPLPAGVGRFEKLPAYVLSRNSAGAVLAEGPGLLIFDAFYNPGATLDSRPGTGSTNQNRQPPAGPVPVGSEMLDSFRTLTNLTPRKAEHTNEDLRVPEREEPALEQVITELQLRGLAREKVLQKVRGFFADKFTYRTWQPPGKLGTNETALSRFLLKTHAGHCEYFATASTLLLRRLDIPTRYAVGYAVHETSGSGYVVRLRDAHAWCLVWNEDKKIWDDFDTTPASWVEEEGKHASAFQWLQDAWTRLGFEFAKLRWGQSNLRLYLLIAIVPGLAVLFYQIVFRRGRRRKKAAGLSGAEIFNWPGLDSEFYQLETKLAERGVARGTSEPLNEWLTRVATTPGLTELCAPLQEILRLHYRYRFDPLGLSEVDRDVLRREVKACSESLKRVEAFTSAREGERQ